MSYSRWGNSCWYTFYCNSGVAEKEKENQVILELLDDSPNFKICQRYNCTIAEADELISYMKEFSADVETELYL